MPGLSSFRQMKRIGLIATGVVLFLLSVWGVTGLLLGERYLIAIDREKGRPVFLRFGRAEKLGGACTSRETDDPTSDILANLLDVDGDGRGDFRMSANHLGTHVTCESRRFGLWVDQPGAACMDAAAACKP